jgi:hypothetical protein
MALSILKLVYIKCILLEKETKKVLVFEECSY